MLKLFEILYSVECKREVISNMQRGNRRDSTLSSVKKRCVKSKNVKGFGASVAEAQACDCKRDRLGVRFPLEER